MEFKDIELLAFIISKELGSNKKDDELIKSIRQDSKDYHSALKEIPTEEKKTKIINSPF